MQTSPARKVVNIHEAGKPALSLSAVIGSTETERCEAAPKPRKTCNVLVGSELHICERRRRRRADGR